MKVQFWLKEPRLIIPRLRSLVWELVNPGVPWLSPGAVAYCDGVLTTSMRVLEFGSGRSTPWFARRVGQLTSIEHSKEWFDRVRGLLKQNGLTNVDCMLIPLDHPESDPEHAQYEPLPSYVGVLDAFADQSFDLIIVDGHYRTTCILTCPSKLKAGGLLLIDDINWLGGPQGVPVPDGWRLVHQSGDTLKTTGIWQKPMDDR